MYIVDSLLNEIPVYCNATGIESSCVDMTSGYVKVLISSVRDVKYCGIYSSHDISTTFEISQQSFLIPKLRHFEILQQNILLIPNLKTFFEISTNHIAESLITQNIGEVMATH